ncbi:hypothetical protein PLESTM_001888200 [Pleodorina starrii]|nr:hypothetical protein PLESTM_001888200 [Pleodorina starrii]
MTDEMMQNVFRLYEMLSHIRSKRTPGMAGGWASVVVVKGGIVYDLPLEDQYAGNHVAASRVRGLAEAMRNGTAAGVVPPDSVFLVSMPDIAVCPQRGKGCKVPVFSMCKRWVAGANASDDYDVLLPHFGHMYDHLVFYPWDKKTDKALMRASIQSRMPQNSTRQWLAELQERGGKEAADLLDAGITNNRGKGFKIKLAAPLPIPDHARWRYLFATDGVTASCRLGKLLGMDSVVVKVLRKLRGDPTRCRNIAAAAQRFTYSFLSYHSKTLYVRYALRAYNALFTDMSDFMKRLTLGPAAMAKAGANGHGTHHHHPGGLTLDGLMQQMGAFVSATSDPVAAQRR